MNILVIGGSGFIGTHLVRRLLELGHAPRIYDLAASVAYPALVQRGDVCDAAALGAAMHGMDCLINLAAEHRDDVQPVSRYFTVNVGGAECVAACAARHAIDRLLFVSSVALYGLDQPDADETAAIRPFNAYGQSKAEAEQVYLRWAQQDSSRSLLILRPAVVFGEGNRGNVYTLIEQIRRRRLLMIGNGRNRKSIGYVGNLVDFICRQLEGDAGVRIFNSADKPDLSTAELVATICTLLPGRSPPRFALPYPLALMIGYGFDLLAWLRRRPTTISSVRVRKFCADTCVDTAALQASGFVPRYRIVDGLRRMLAAMHDAGPH